MKRTKKEKANQEYDDLSDQKTGSALYVKTHEDFNNERPEHDDSGLINGNNPSPDTNIAEAETKKSAKKLMKKSRTTAKR